MNGAITFTIWKMYWTLLQVAVSKLTMQIAISRILIFSLTLTVAIQDEEKKLTQLFIFTLLCGASKGFMKALKAYIKSFEALQRSVKIQTYVIFCFHTISEIYGTGRVNWKLKSLMKEFQEKSEKNKVPIKSS